MEIYQYYWVAQYYQNDDKVVHCKFVYDQDTNVAKQNDTIFYPYGEESSNKDNGSPGQDDALTSINTIKISKKEKSAVVTMKIFTPFPIRQWSMK